MRMYTIHDKLDTKGETLRRKVRQSFESRVWFGVIVLDCSSRDLWLSWLQSSAVYANVCCVCQRGYKVCFGLVRSLYAR